MAQGSISSSAQRSHSSSKVVWARSKGPSTPVRTRPGHLLGLLQGGMAGQHQVGRQGPDLAGQAPDVEVVDLPDPGYGGDGCAQGGQVDVGRGGLEQDVGAGPDQADGLHDDQGGHHQ